MSHLIQLKYNIYLPIIISSMFLYSCINSSEDKKDVNLQLSFFDVGQGDALLINSSGKNYLVDAGPDSCGINDSLTNRGIYNLEWVVLSHFDLDHFGGMFELLSDQRIDIEKIFINSSEVKKWHVDSLFSLISDKNIPVEVLWRNKTFPNINDFKVEVLWPPHDLEDVYIADDENNKSIVLRVYDEISSVLLMGDADTLVEKELIKLEKNDSSNMQSEIIKIAHHGSKSATSLDFLEAVRPRFSVISVGENPYGHPHHQVLADLNYIFKNDTSRVLKTHNLGTIDFKWLQNFGIILQKKSPNK